MDAGSWERIEATLARLEGLAEAEREAALRELERGEPEVAGAARRALEQSGVPAGFLDPVIDAGSGAQAAGLLPGTRIGPYELGRRLGSGGMGAVFEARQGSPRRTVALKVMQLGAASPEALRRFRYESELLARLQHPAIAQVYEAGTQRLTAGAGGLELPWYAMELVPGARNLLLYAADEGLDFERRLALFRRLCDAVQHGHQRGVLHRDLKPSNLLVSAGGEPKVIDFGVARPLEPDGPSARVTRTGEVVGTLRYMSPEQLAGDPRAVDVRADVYALGAVLFELLAGRAPHELGDLPLHEAARVVGETPAPRPSSFAPGTAAELDWIVLKALEHDPERRYRSAAELSADLGRLLAHEPLAAGPPSAVYRLRKFVRRHKLAVGAASAVALALLAGAGFANLGRIQAKESAEHARLETRKAREASRFLSDLLSAPSVLALGRDARVVDLLAEARARLAQEREPQVRADAQRALGLAYQGLGLYPEAAELLAPALEAERERLGEDDPRVLELVAALWDARRWLGQLEPAGDALSAALARSERLHGPGHPASNSLRKGLALLRGEQLRYDEALRLLTRTVELRAGGDELERLRDLADLSALHLGAGGVEDAERLAREAHAGMLALRGPRDGNTLMAEARVASVLTRGGRLPEAVEVLERLAREMRAALGEQHLLRLQVQQELANTYRGLGRLRDAVALYRELLESTRERYGEAGEMTLLASVGLAASLLGQGQLEEPRELLERVIELGDDALGEDHELLLGARANLSAAWRRAGEHDAADALDLRLIEDFERVHGPGGSLLPAYNLANHWMQLERWSGAEAVLADLIPHLRENPPPEPEWLGKLLGMRGRCLVMLERYEQAEPLLLEAHAGLSSLWPSSHPGVRYQAATLTLLHQRTGRDAQAALWRERANATE